MAGIVMANPGLTSLELSGLVPYSRIKTATLLTNLRTMGVLRNGHRVTGQKHHPTQLTWFMVDGGPSPVRTMLRRSREERIISFIDFDGDGGCWLWTGQSNRGGYGLFSEWVEGRKRTVPAHRVTFGLFRDEPPDSLDLDHLCRVRACVNPWHLEPVTRRENLARGINYQRNKTHCINGHEFTKENTSFTTSIRTGLTRRRCRSCTNASGRRKYWRDKTDAR